jgi:hypothetical protein
MAVDKDMLAQWHHLPQADDAVLTEKDLLLQAKLLMQLGSQFPYEEFYVQEEAYRCLQEDVARLLRLYLQ